MNNYSMKKWANLLYQNLNNKKSSTEALSYLHWTHPYHIIKHNIKRDPESSDHDAPTFFLIKSYFYNNN